MLLDQRRTLQGALQLGLPVMGAKRFQPRLLLGAWSQLRLEEQALHTPLMSEWVNGWQVSVLSCEQCSTIHSWVPSNCRSSIESTMKLTIE